MGPFAGGYLSTRTWGTWDENASDERVTRKSRLAQRGREAKSNRWFEDLLEKLQKALEIGQGAYGKNPFTSFDWNRFQKGIDPMYGKLDEERSIRKRQQVENLLVVLTPLIKDRDVVVEFGAGSGHVALVLAALFPLCTFVLVDKKHQSLDIARERIAMAKLVNVQIVCGFIDDFKEQFDVGIALHACGEATDMALDKCVAMGASYVMAPCCVGKIKHSSLCYPRSKMVRTLLNREEYSVRLQFNVILISFLKGIGQGS